MKDQLELFPTLMEAEDMAVVAWHILSTAFMDVVLNNIGMIKEALDGLEDEDDAEE